MAQPALISQPKDRFLASGQESFLIVGAPLSAAVQWFYNGATLPNETNRTLRLRQVNVGDYFAVATDATGSTTSRVARVKVFLPASHGIGGVILNPSRSVAMRFTGETTAVYGPYADLYPLEASSDLLNWIPLATLRRVNADLTTLSFTDSDAAQAGLRFYRLATNHFPTYLPAPSGPFRVGVHSRRVTDSDRPKRRPFMISLWYPGVAKAGVWPAPFMDSRVAGRWWDNLGKGGTSQMFQVFYSHALPEVPLASQLGYPVVIYSPGAECPRSWSLAQFEDLASHGYIVVSIDHEDAVASVHPDGKIISGILPATTADVPPFVQQRVQDVQFVINELARWNKSDSFFQECFDLERIGIFGFSLGGETVMKVAASEARCKAVVCLDGSANTPLPAAAFSRPLLNVYLALEDFRSTYLTFFKRFTKDAYYFEIKKAAHGDGDDSGLVWDTDQIGYTPPTEAHLRVGMILRAYTFAFFNKYLKGQDDHVLDGPLPDYSEIQNYLKK